MLVMENITCEIDDYLLFKNISISISPGTILRIDGENGSGKTTLLKIIAGLNDNFTGKISYNGQKIKSHLFVGHKSGIKLSLTPLENLTWWGILNGKYTQQNYLEALKQTNLEHIKIPCYQLSAGQCQRVVLSRLWLTKTNIWILDEPFNYLDVFFSKKIIQKLLLQLANQGIIILTTHQLPLELTKHTHNIDLKKYS